MKYARNTLYIAARDQRYVTEKPVKQKGPHHTNFWLRIVYNYEARARDLRYRLGPRLLNAVLALLEAKTRCVCNAKVCIVV